MRALDKNLTILSEAERAALYGLPDFDDFQRAEYLALSAEELTLIQRRVGLPEQISCILQIGRFLEGTNRPKSTALQPQN